VVKENPGSGLDKFNVQIFTASCDTVETNTRYAKELKLDYPILSDPKKTTAKEYGVVSATRSLPQRWTFIIGKDGKILHIEKGVKAGEHNKQLAAKFAELKIEAAPKKGKK
jgi:peroxiredoxin Q/BCP